MLAWSRPDPLTRDLIHLINARRHDHGDTDDAITEVLRLGFFIAASQDEPALDHAAWQPRPALLGAVVLSLLSWLISKVL